MFKNLLLKNNNATICENTMQAFSNNVNFKFFQLYSTD